MRFSLFRTRLSQLGRYGVRNKFLFINNPANPAKTFTFQPTRGLQFSETTPRLWPGCDPVNRALWRRGADLVKGLSARAVPIHDVSATGKSGRVHNRIGHQKTDSRTRLNRLSALCEQRAEYVEIMLKSGASRLKKQSTSQSILCKNLNTELMLIKLTRLRNSVCMFNKG